jgi:hypothetical protein
MNSYINNIIELYKEYNFSFDEVDNAIFFIDLDYFELTEYLKKNDDFSMELIRDYILIKRGIESVEHKKWFNK